MLLSDQYTEVQTWPLLYYEYSCIHVYYTPLMMFIGSSSLVPCVVRFPPGVLVLT